MSVSVKHDFGGGGIKTDMRSVKMLTVTLDGIDISMDPETDFHIDENDTDGELCKSGRLLSFYGQLAADLKAQAVTFKAKLEVRDSQESIGIRAEGNKITE